MLLISANLPTRGQMIDFLINLPLNLDRFWEGFGGQVGAKLGPSGNKTRTHKQSKKWSLFGRLPEGFGLDFGSQVGGSRGGPQIDFLEVCWLLGPSWRPEGRKSSQEAPRGSQDSLQKWFWKHFGWFLVDFLVVFWLVWRCHVGSFFSDVFLMIFR